MQRTICSGCGASAPIGKEDEGKIQRVTLIIHSNDHREWARKHDPRHTEDLCDDCIGGMLHKYFAVSAKGQLTLPAFVQ